MSASTFIYALIAGLIPSLIWLWFWMREDVNPEPRLMIFLTFLGGTATVIAAVFVEKYIFDTVKDVSLQYTLWAATEEILKFAAVAMIALGSGYNDEPIDALVYCITGALGFAALENTLFLWDPLASGEIAQSIATNNLRFIGATLVHVVSSASVGFALGFVYYRHYWSKVVAVILGLSAAIALHTAFNLFIINSIGSDTLKVFFWVWVAVIILMVLFEEVKVVRPKSTG